MRPAGRVEVRCSPSSTPLNFRTDGPEVEGKDLNFRTDGPEVEGEGGDLQDRRSRSGGGGSSNPTTLQTLIKRREENKMEKLMTREELKKAIEELPDDVVLSISFEDPLRGTEGEDDVCRTD